MKRNWLIIVTGCLVIHAEIGRAGEGDTNAAPEHVSPEQNKPAPITSHNRNFIVTDLPRSGALGIAVWAESVRELLAGWAGVAIPGEQGYPVVISAVSKPEEAQGKVLKAQGYSPDGLRQQEITLINPEVMDQEDLLEALCWLMLNRWIHVRQPAQERHQQPGKYPDWFAVGVAQNLYPELKARNLQEFKNMESKGGYQPASVVFDYTYLSPGRWPEKAQSGLVVAWLAEYMTPAELINRTADMIAHRTPLDLAGVLSLTGLPDRRAVNMAWDVWLARQDQRFIPGVLSSDYQAVARILEMHPEDVGLVLPSPIPGDRLTSDILIRNRKKQWAKDVSRTIGWNLRQAAIGKSPDLLACIDRYIYFYDGIAPLPVKRNKKKLPSPASSRELVRRWSDAETAWKEFVQQQTSRNAIINEYSGGDQPVSGVTSTAVNQLMNRWEKTAQ